MSADLQLGVFEALSYRFRVSVVGTAAVDLRRLLAGLAADVRPEAHYEFDFTVEGHDVGELRCDGELVAHGRTRVLLQMLITHVGLAINHRCPACAIHATTLRLRDTGVLLAGPSGRGKSTLSTRMLRGGASLVAEDISVLGRELDVWAYHRPLGLSETSFELLDLDVPEDVGAPCGCGAKILLTPQHLGADLAAATRPTVVALVDHSDDVLQRLSPAAMLAALLEAGVVVTPNPPADLDRLARMLATATCVRLGSADLDVAAEWLHQLATAPPRPAVETLVETRGEHLDVYLGTEAVLVRGDAGHLLGNGAAAVWLLRSEGLGVDDIARELAVPAATVRDLLGQIERLATR